MVVAAVVDVEGPEVVEEEAVDVGERRRLVSAVAAAVVVGGAVVASAAAVQRWGSGEPAGGEEAVAGDLRWDG